MHRWRPAEQLYCLGRRAATVVLVSADKGAEQLGVVQQVHIADVLLADVGMRGLPHPRRLVLVAEQEADCRSERRQVGGIGLGHGVP